MRDYRIFVYPEPAHNSIWGRDGNPHAQFLFSGLVDTYGANRVFGVSSKELLGNKFLKSLGQNDVIVVHWTDPLIVWPFLNENWLLLDNVLWKLLPGFWMQLKLVRLSMWHRSLKRLQTKIVKVVHEVVQHDIRGKRTTVDKRIRSIIYESCASLVVLERSTLPEVYKAFGRRKVPVFWSPIGDLEQFHGHRRNKADARSALGLSPDKSIVLLLGAARKSRSFEALLGCSVSPNLFFLVAGPGYEGFPGSSSRHKIMGFVGRHDLATVASASDYIINHGRNYLNSAALRLAVSYGKPVIAYNSGAAVDLNRGCLVEIVDSTPLCETLASLPEPHSGEYLAMCKSAEHRNRERGWGESLRGLVGAIENARLSK